MSYDGSLEPYQKAGAYLGMKRKRMFAGTITNTAQNVHALVFDASKLDFFNEDVLLNAPDSIPSDFD